MKKLFLYDINRKDAYSQQLELAYNLVKDNSEKKLISKNNINYNYLEKFDVIISNALPIKYELFAKENKIILIYFESHDKKNNCDIIIDFKYKKNTNNFTGNKFKILKRKPNEFKFELLFNIIVLLKWDTEFWGYPVSLITTRILSDSIIYRTNLFIKKNKIKLTQYLCNCHDNYSVDCAEKYNYKFKDIRLTFKKVLNLNLLGKKASDSKFRKATIKDFKILKKLSVSIYKNSRYYFDSNFNLKKVQDFYDQWLYKAINNSYDNECLIYCVKKKPVSYCTLRYIDNETAIIGLFGVGKKYSGKGYGKKLMNEVAIFLKAKRFKKIVVVTQGRNLKAQRFYQKEGFLIDNTELWYHKWI